MRMLCKKFNSEVSGFIENVYAQARDVRKFTTNFFTNYADVTYCTKRFVDDGVEWIKKPASQWGLLLTGSSLLLGVAGEGPSARFMEAAGGLGLLSNGLAFAGKERLALEVLRASSVPFMGAASGLSPDDILNICRGAEVSASSIDVGKGVTSVALASATTLNLRGYGKVGSCVFQISPLSLAWSVKDSYVDTGVFNAELAGAAVLIGAANVLSAKMNSGADVSNEAAPKNP